MSSGDRLRREAIWAGWLIKSPPRKKFEKIWKCRWRRRWFVLRQGELPGQFCLEYYVDQKCAKLKGQIDLDQCEEVDAGLRLVEKYQNIFVVTIPQRIYYLAADSEEDMRAWVKCICQVCGLQDITEISPAGTSGASGASGTSDVQYLNIGKDGPNEQQIANMNATNNNLMRDNANNYQNFNTLERGFSYSNRETILCEASLTNNNEITNEYTNWGTSDRDRTLKGKPGISHNRTQSLEQTPRRPDNLNISGSSGPYIAISECYSGPRFHQYSPKHNSDNESVFTDDEWTHPVLPHLRSETALDSDLQWTQMKRFGKGVPPRPPKRADGDLSPFIGPRDSKATIEEGYDIPRSHQNVGHSRQASLFDEPSNISPLDMSIIASSTPNLLQNEGTGTIGSRTLPRKNWYTNAAPTKIEGSIFRYDFLEGCDAPAVNRKLKPKTTSESSTASTTNVSQVNNKHPPPSVDRKLKPAKPPGGGRTSNTKALMNITLPDEHTLANFHDDVSFILPKTPKHSDDRLQYLDLDHSHVPPPVAAKQPPNGSAGNLSRAGASMASDCPSVAYTTVDFLKTDAFNRIRADSARRNNVRPK